MGEFWETIAAVFAGGNWVSDVLGWSLTAASALILLRLVMMDLGRCILLLRRMHRGQASGRWPALASMLMRLAFADGTLFSRDRRTLVRRTRILLEQEIFVPRPQFHWPLPDDDPDYAEETMHPDRGRRGRSAAWRRYRQKLRAWNEKSLRKWLKIDGDWTIYVGTPADINAHMSDVKRYFDTVKSVGIDDADSDRFICAIEIGTGFIAPIHLLTGLLIEFNEKWEKILEAFNRDANDSRGLSLREDAADVRQIQMFIYNCWLLWGPSIPLCGCGAWTSRYQVLQYGFGDENNSIEVVGEASSLSESLDRLLAQQTGRERARRYDGERVPEARPLQEMAVPASVRGQLRLSGSLRRVDRREVNALPNAALNSWGGGQDERPVLFVSEIERRNPLDGSPRQDDVKRGHIVFDNQAEPSRYYSAYLWVGFVILGQAGKNLWKPVSELAGREPQPWKDFVPFFEHGNLADSESCGFAKLQLATKTIAAFATLVRRWPAGRFPHRFAFSCAIDESGCGHPLAFPAWAGGMTLRERLIKALDQGADEWNDPAYRRLRDESILVFGYRCEGEGETAHHDYRGYSACSLPKHIAAHYSTFEP